MALAVVQFPAVVASSLKGSTSMFFWILTHYKRSDYYMLNLITVTQRL